MRYIHVQLNNERVFFFFVHCDSALTHSRRQELEVIEEKHPEAKYTSVYNRTHSTTLELIHAHLFLYTIISVHTFLCD